ncbi:MAG: sodium:solute symporter family protein [Desulfotomaculales bacterium]
MSLTGIVVLILGYLAVTAYLGYLGYRHTRTAADYLVAGGRAHPFLMALAYGSTFISTSAIVGFGGVAAAYGMGLLWLVFANIFFGIFIAFVLYGKKTAVMGKELGAHTLPEFLGRRFGSDFIRRAAGGIIAVAMPLYAAAVMIAGARFMEQMLHIDFRTAVLIFAAIVGAYVITGGLKSVFYTDALQASIMLVGMTVLLVFTYVQLGGVAPAHQTLTNLAGLVPESLVSKGHQGWTSMPLFGSELWWVMVSTLILGVGIGVLAQPQLVVRFLTVRGPRELNRGVVIGGIFILVVVGASYVVGALSNVYFHRTIGKVSLLAAVNPATGQPNIDAIIPLYINAAMPAWFGYIFMLTLLAAAMSTLSGQFHMIGTAISHDLYQGAGIRVNRLGILVALVLTVVLCFRLPVSIVAVATAAFFAICAAVFLPTYTAALFWPRATKHGAIASMVTGLLMSLFMMTFFHAKEATAFGVSQALFGKPTLANFPWTVVDPILFSLPASTLVLVAVSVLTRPAGATVTLPRVSYPDLRR